MRVRLAFTLPARVAEIRQSMCTIGRRGFFSEEACHQSRSLSIPSSSNTSRTSLETTVNMRSNCRPVCAMPSKGNVLLTSARLEIILVGASLLHRRYSPQLFPGERGAQTQTSAPGFNVPVTRCEVISSSACDELNTPKPSLLDP